MRLVRGHLSMTTQGNNKLDKKIEKLGGRTNKPTVSRSSLVMVSLILYLRGPLRQPHFQGLFLDLAPRSQVREKALGTRLPLRAMWRGRHHKGFLQTIFLQGWVIDPKPNLQPARQGYV